MMDIVQVLVQQRDRQVQTIRVQDPARDTGRLVDIIQYSMVMLAVLSMGHICKEVCQEPPGLSNHH